MELKGSLAHFSLPGTYSLLGRVLAISTFLYFCSLFASPFTSCPAPNSYCVHLAQFPRASTQEFYRKHVTENAAELPGRVMNALKELQPHDSANWTNDSQLVGWGVSAEVCAMLSRRLAKLGSPVLRRCLAAPHFSRTGNIAGRGAPEGGLLTGVTALRLPCAEPRPNEEGHVPTCLAVSGACLLLMNN